MLIDIWLDVPCKAFDPPGMHKRSKRLLFLPVWGKLMHFLNSFSDFVFALLFPLTRTGVDFLGCIDCP